MMRADHADTFSGVSTIGPSSPVQASALQAAQAQQSASKARDREKSQSASDRLMADEVELRVAGVETNTAARQLPQNNSEQEREEREAHGQDATKSRGHDKTRNSRNPRPRIDMKA